MVFSKAFSFIISFYYMQNCYCNCACNNCKKVKNYEIKADGGYNITTPDGKHESHRIKQNIYMQNKNLLNK